MLNYAQGSTTLCKSLITWEAHIEKYTYGEKL